MYLVQNKLEFLSKIHDIEFELNKHHSDFNISEEEIQLLKKYLSTSTIYVYTYLDELVKNNPSFLPKLQLFKDNIKEVELLKPGELEIFTKLISKQMIDRPLTLYRGTSKIMFSITSLINNDPSLTFQQLKVNDTIKTLSCSSTTLDPFIAADFSCGGKYGYLLIQIDDYNEQALWANPFSGYHEKEFILPPNHEFIVDEITHIDLSITDTSTKEEDGINYIKIHRRG